MTDAQKRGRQIEINNSIPDDERNAMILEALPHLVNFAFSRFGRSIHRRFGDADEFSSELTLLLFRVFPSYDPSRGIFRTWAVWRVRQLFSHWAIKYQRRKGFLSLISSIEKRDLENLEIRRERLSKATQYDLEEYRSTLQTLEPRRRFVVQRYEQGFTLEEIGQEIGVCRERVRQLLDDGIIRIRKQLGIEVTDHRLSQVDRQRKAKKTYAQKQQRKKQAAK